MSLLFDVVEGWTGRLPAFTLKVNGVPLPLTGFLVEIRLRSFRGVVVPGGTVFVEPDQTLNPGVVYYTPISTDFVFLSGGSAVRQTYQIHWKVTDGSGKVVYFPNGEPDEIGVYKP